jgi:hypothetical protein
MRALLKFLRWFAYGIPFVLIGGCLWMGPVQWWRFDHLEQSARKRIRAAELQNWATNIIASYPGLTPFQAYQLRTNFPPKIESLCRSRIAACWVFVNSHSVTNSQGQIHEEADYLQIIWSQKPSGDAAFIIGPPTFVYDHPKAHAWGPGVYFQKGH